MAMAEADDAVLASVLRRILTDPDFNCLVLEDGRLLIDGWVDINPDEAAVVARVGEL